MLEWLEVRLDVGCVKRLVYEYRIEPLNCNRDALNYTHYYAQSSSSSSSSSLKFLEWPKQQRHHKDHNVNKPTRNGILLKQTTAYSVQLDIMPTILAHHVIIVDFMF